MKHFWVVFDDGSSGCCDGENDFEAKRIAEHVQKKTASAVNELPYAAKPTIWAFDHPIFGKPPAFCYTPEHCQGRKACPKNYACSE